jgi:hypothetical protein
MPQSSSPVVGPEGAEGSSQILSLKLLLQKELYYLVSDQGGDVLLAKSSITTCADVADPGPSEGAEGRQ